MPMNIMRAYRVTSEYLLLLLYFRVRVGEMYHTENLEWLESATIQRYPKLLDFSAFAFHPFVDLQRYCRHTPKLCYLGEVHTPS